jgi:hypothetical protein
MLFQVINIDFDLSDSLGELPDNYHADLEAEYIGTWEADDEDDLIEELTCAAGWCIKSLDYVHVLS